MHVTFVGPTVEENLAIGHLVAAVRDAGQTASVVSFVRDEDVDAAARQIVDSQPDVVGLSLTFQTRARGFAALARRLRALGFAGRIVAGGHFASLAAAELLDAVPELDGVLRGEADHSIVVLLGAFSGRNAPSDVPGLVLGRGVERVVGPRPDKPADLDALPLPARSNAPRLELGLAVEPLVSSRGCRGHCTYCSITTFGRLSRGPARRERSPERVAAEMAQLARERGTRVFVFHDDDFFCGDLARDLVRLERLRAALDAADLPPYAFSVKARPDDLHAELVEMAHGMGLRQVVLGIDNDAPQALAALGRHTGDGAQQRALRLLHASDIAVGSNLLLWEPGTTLAELRTNLALMHRFPGQLFNLARTEPYEGAPLTQQLAHRGALRGTLWGRDYTMGDARAELSWQLFRRVLAERCYPADGVMQRAIRLDWHRRLLTTFHPSTRADLLAERVADGVGRLARSNRRLLGTLIELAEEESADNALNGAVRALAAARRSEDTAIGAELDDLQTALHGAAQQARRARQRGQQGPPRSRGFWDAPVRQVSRALAIAGAVATCTCAGCAGGGVQVATDDAVTTGQMRAADSAAIVLTRLNENIDEPRCGGCSYASGYRVVSVDLAVEAPQGWTFERLETSDGASTLLATSPNRRRALARLQPTGSVHTVQICVAYRTATGEEVVQTSDYYAGTAEDMHCEPGPCSDPVGDFPYMDAIGSVPPPAPEELDRQGAVVFGNVQVMQHQWPQAVVFGVGLVDPSGGTAVATAAPAPEVKCDFGSVTGWTSAPQAPEGLASWGTAIWSSAPSGGAPAMVAGTHTCEVALQDHAGRTHRAVIRFTLDEDGAVGVVVHR